MRLGFGQVDITPAAGLPIAGMPGSPVGTGVQWPLRGRVLLADDGERRAAVVCLDLMALPATAVAELRAVLTGPGSLDPEAILVACSHTHRAPFTFIAGDADEATVFGYLDSLYELLGAAMADAAAALQPAELTLGRIAVPGWGFNRRPIYEGGEVATHGRTWLDGFVAMEGPADPELHVLQARGRDGAALGGLVGFACHPTAMIFEPVYSADYAGALAEELETRHGGVFGFLLGAAGNITPPDPSSRDPENGLGREHAAAMGRALADAADGAIRGARGVEMDRIRVARILLRIPQRRPTPEEVELARWYLEEAPDDLDEREFRRRIYGHPYDHYGNDAPGCNERFVREILGMWEWQRRASTRELVEAVEVQVLAIGDVAFAAYPVELFCEFGLRLKSHSPFPDMFVATLANGWHGYAPTPEAFERGGYEPRLGYASRLVPDAGDRMTDAALELLARIASEVGGGES
jgi:hypothetical protein